jgi:WD40 repeat protein
VQTLAKKTLTNICTCLVLHMAVPHHTPGALVTCLRADRYVVNCCDSHPSLPLMASCGIDSTIKLWTPCLSSPRPLSDALLFSMGYNELQQAAEGCALYTGFSDMCKAFSRQRAERLVQQYRAEQRLAAADAGV